MRQLMQHRDCNQNAPNARFRTAAPSHNIGNQARLLALAPRLQPKLKIGAMDDPLEHEADAVADRVMRKCASCEEESPRAPPVAAHDEEIPVSSGQPLVGATAASNDELMRKPAAPAAGAPAVAAPLAGTAGGGRPLDAATRNFFAPRFGQSFSDVRIHTDAHAAASAQAVNALAYTIGKSIVFAAGQYAPKTDAGRRLLAHELAHVQQQNDGTLRRWSADGPADRSINTIVCDGAGGIRVQTGTGNDPAGFACVGDCVIRHEASHRADALAANATVCNGKDNGSQVNFTTAEQGPSERKAAQVEIDCLNAGLPTASAACRPTFQARITRMIAYRDSFR
jgi:hypothetical protein